VAKTALDLDRASPPVSRNLAMQFYLARQFDQAIEQCQKTTEMDPNRATADQVLGQGISREECTGKLCRGWRSIQRSREAALTPFASRFLP
jgi:hypothetical protein